MRVGSDYCKNTVVYQANFSTVIILLSMMWLFTACSSAPPLLSLKSFPKPPDQANGALQPGDSIDIKFQYWPELDDSQTIRPDGKITLQLVDDVAVAGLTSAQVDALLTKLYADKLKNPEISVIVRSLANRFVYVTGEVFTPGGIELGNKMTLLSAIMSAGGFNKTAADTSNVVVVRFSDEKYHATAINLEENLTQAESEPFYLAAHDVVYVPRTKIYDLNQWVEQYISRMLPATGAFSYQVSKPQGNEIIQYGVGQ